MLAKHWRETGDGTADSGSAHAQRRVCLPTNAAGSGYFGRFDPGR